MQTMGHQTNRVMKFQKLLAVQTANRERGVLATDNISSLKISRIQCQHVNYQRESQDDALWC